MKTRNILLLFAAVILLTTSSAVMAQPFSCNRCTPLAPSHCARAFKVDGFTTCVVDETGCYLSGDQCAPISAPPLASEYVVATVERVDEPKTASAPLVAPDATEPPTR
jgi:hypothetical protein